MALRPAAVVEVVARQAQAVAARGVGERVVAVVRKLVHARRLEGGADDHPGAVVDDAARALVAAGIGHHVAALLAQWPAGEHRAAARRVQAAVGETRAHLVRPQRLRIDRGHDDVAFEECVRQAIDAAAAKAQRRAARLQRAVEAAARDGLAVEPQHRLAAVHVAMT